jgi:hypothetical protein
MASIYARRARACQAGVVHEVYSQCQTINCTGPAHTHKDALAGAAGARDDVQSRPKSNHLLVNQSKVLRAPQTQTRLSEIALLLGSAEGVRSSRARTHPYSELFQVCVAAYVGGSTAAVLTARYSSRPVQPCLRSRNVPAATPMAPRAAHQPRGHFPSALWTYRLCGAALTAFGGVDYLRHNIHRRSAHAGLLQREAEAQW